jgi:hypothetical protein
MKLLVICLILAFSCSLVYAGSSYDWQSGNSYNYSTDSFGNTNIRGHNYKTGSNWNTTVKPDGSMNGRDGEGNYWRYNSGSGYYYNYGTGKTCVGKGASRYCY